MVGLYSLRINILVILFMLPIPMILELLCLHNIEKLIKNDLLVFKALIIPSCTILIVLFTAWFNTMD